MKTFLSYLLAILVGIALFFCLSKNIFAYPTNTISNIYVFGDSVSDMGNNQTSGTYDDYNTSLQRH